MILPTPQQCLDLFVQYKVPQRIREHCLAVQKVAVFLAEGLRKAGVPIDLELVRAGAVLHDLFKAAALKDIAPTKYYPNTFTAEEMAMRDELQKKYPGKYESEIAYEIFKESFPELALVLLHEGDPHLRQRTIEESIIHYADYRVFLDKVVSLQERFDYFRERYPAEEGFWQEYYAYCLEEEKKIFKHLPFLPDELASQKLMSQNLTEH